MGPTDLEQTLRHLQLVLADLREDDPLAAAADVVAAAVRAGLIEPVA